MVIFSATLVTQRSQESRRLACETPGGGNLLRGRANAAQPGNRRRRFAPQRAQASSPAKRSAMVTFAIGFAALRSQESRRLACETLGDGNHQRLHNRRRRGRLLSLLCRAPKGDSQAFAAGATLAKNTNACTTDAGETPAFQAFAAGATLARNHQRLHNRRRRGRLRSLFCRAPEGDSPAFAAGATLNHPDDKNHRRLLSLLCRAPSAIAGLAPWRHLVASSRCRLAFFA